MERFDHRRILLVFPLFLASAGAAVALSARYAGGVPLTSVTGVGNSVSPR
ncbi:hypothetical protein [Arthrobacter sp. 31Y]|nr:hypothetical protein [Arthrobacter sp. 31Y]